VHAEMDWLSKVFDIGRAMRPLVLLNADMTGMGY